MSRKSLLVVLALAVVAAACSDSADPPGASSPPAQSGEEQRTPASEPTTAPATSTAAKTPTPLPSTPTPAADGRSRDSAAPIGTESLVHGWLIRVNGVMPDATAAVLAENRFNSRPEAGRQYYIANVTATCQGTKEPASIWLEVSFKAVGESGVVYTPERDSCGVVPDELDELRELFRGGSITGNVCWSVTAADAASLKMYAESVEIFSRERFWWDLAAGGGVLELPSGDTATVVGTGSCLNVRASPSTTGLPVTCLPDGAEVQLLGDRTYGEGRWWLEVAAGTHRGWAAEEFVRR